MKLIEIKATKLEVDIKKNTITYTSDVNAPAGILLQADKAGTHDMMIANAVHEGGPVTLTMKPFRSPARRYEVGDVVAVLMVNG